MHTKLVGFVTTTAGATEALTSAQSMYYQADYTTATNPTNAVYIVMNAFPSNGPWVYAPTSGAPNVTNYNATGVTSVMERYGTYLPIGAKVTIDFFFESASVSLAPTFEVFGFPFITMIGGNGQPTSPSNSYANGWDGQGVVNGSPANSEIVPQMKYGFSKRFIGGGGRSVLRYSTYWDFAKLAGLTKQQYMADNSFGFVQRVGVIPVDPPWRMVLGLATQGLDTTDKLMFTVRMKQYGRWQGQILGI